MVQSCIHYIANVPDVHNSYEYLVTYSYGVRYQWQSLEQLLGLGAPRQAAGHVPTVLEGTRIYEVFNIYDY